MALFRKYDKVERWDHKDEIDGINIGIINVQEKIDGANGQVFFDIHTGMIYVGCRTRVLGRRPFNKPDIESGYDPFRGFTEHILYSHPIQDFLRDHPNLRLYGEWLVKHTVNYAPESQNRFWIFDVYNDETQEFIPYESYAGMLKEYGLDFIPVIGVLVNPSMDDLLDMVRKNDLTPKSGFGAEMIEGLVFKNYDFVNNWGHRPYMKAVTKDFREVHHAVMGANRYDDVELQLVAKYLQPARMEKICQKMKDEHSHLEMKNVPQFLGLVFHDLITEDAWEMFVRSPLIKRSQYVVNMRTLKKHSDIKAKNFYIAKLQEEVAKS